MIHNITAGHFDPARVADRVIVPHKPLDMKTVRGLLDELAEVNPEGAPTLDGWKVRFDNGCVIVPWLGGRTNYVAEEFAIRLHRATGCLLADREHGRMIEPGQLTGLGPGRASSPVSTTVVPRGLVSGASDSRGNAIRPTPR